MHLTTSVLSLLAASAAITEARSLPGFPLPVSKNVAKQHSNVVQLDFNVKRTSEVLNPRHKRLRQRLAKRKSDTVDVQLQNMFTYYNVECAMGTPPQQFNILIDTGSSDLWLIGKGNQYCASTPDEVASGEYINCSISGTFDSSASSTFHKNSSDFFIQYGDNSVAEGDWATDTFTISGVTIENMSFGVGSTTNSSTGIVGVGYASNEASESIQNDPYSYQNLPLKLAEQGAINVPAYSLWLNDINSNSGSILFGGVDHAKYTGTLSTVPILVPSGGFSGSAASGAATSSSSPTAFLVALDGVQLNTQGSSSVQIFGSSSNSDNALYALLDSGTSLTYFPEDVAQEILTTHLDAQYDSDLGFYVQSCNQNGNLTYSFSGATITVPFSELFIPITNNENEPLVEKGVPICAIGILPFSDDFALLGDTFLRNAYVVYDLQNNEIALAQSNLNATDSDIEAIVSTIPSAKNAPLYSSTIISSIASGKITDAPHSSPIVEGSSIPSFTFGGSNTATATSTTKKSGASTVSAPGAPFVVSVITLSILFSTGFLCIFA